MGSVKNLEIKTKATEKETGVGVFVFTDDYSIFDYGKMPDTIPGKGEALCRMSSYNFNELKKLGIKSHFRKLVSGNEMESDLVRVLYPGKDRISTKTTNYLIPLEVMFRNSLPEGSSMLSRIESGEVDYRDYGLSSKPLAGEPLEKPVVDVATKLEPTDRYLAWGEARKLAGLTKDEQSLITETALKINDYLNKKAASIGLEHADGKVEFGFGPDRELILLDVVGTLDENRFLYHGINLSKQVLRDYYATMPWAQQVKQALKKGVPKEELPKPTSLPPGLIKIAANLYRSVCEEWTGEKVWKVPKLEDVVAEYIDFKDQLALETGT